MCGIAGILTARGTIEPREIEAVTAALAHRGPDDTGLFHGEGIALGHRRLSVVDLSPRGHQPMLAPDGRTAIVFNGEIYNCQEMRKELGRNGVTFRSTSDTEVILHAYRETGASCPSRLHGMFAFAVWDAANSTLFMARDRAGKKPLYYYCDGTRMAFASELTALRQVPWVPAGIDREQLLDYLYLQYVPGPGTVIKGIRRLPPGHWLAATRADGKISLEIRPFWRPPARSAEEDLGGPALEEHVERLLRDSIRRRLIADVDVGILLSGGLDSSLLAAMAARECGGGIQSFSVSFADAAFDESRHATAVARLSSARHHHLCADEITPDTFRHIIRHMDEPLADPACLPTFMIARLASRHIKVVLSGEGADELFHGYQHWVAERRFTPFVRFATGKPALGAALNAVPRPAVLDPVFRRVARILASRPEDGMTRWTQLFDDTDLRRFCTPELRGLRAGHDPLAAVLRARRESAAPSPYARALEAEFRTWLPDDLLVKIDRMTMAHGLEARCPYLDYRMVECVLPLSPEAKLAGLGMKGLLKKIARRYLPEDIIMRRKHGFECPTDHWLRGPLREPAEEAFAPAHLKAWDFFDGERVRREWTALKERGRSRYPRRTWAVFVLLSWLLQHRPLP